MKVPLLYPIDVAFDCKVMDLYHNYSYEYVHVFINGSDVMTTLNRNYPSYGSAYPDVPVKFGLFYDKGFTNEQLVLVISPQVKTYWGYTTIKSLGFVIGENGSDKIHLDNNVSMEWELDESSYYPMSYTIKCENSLEKIYDSMKLTCYNQLKDRSGARGSYILEKSKMDLEKELTLNSLAMAAIVLTKSSLNVTITTDTTSTSREESTMRIWNQLHVNNNFEIRYAIGSDIYRFNCKEYTPGDELDDLPLFMNCKTKLSDPFTPITIENGNVYSFYGFVNWEKLKAKVIKTQHGYSLEITGSHLYRKYHSLAITKDTTALELKSDFMDNIDSWSILSCANTK